jgi:hypothetical protein
MVRSAHSYNYNLIEYVDERENFIPNSYTSSNPLKTVCVCAETAFMVRA